MAPCVSCKFELPPDFTAPETHGRTGALCIPCERELRDPLAEMFSRRPMIWRVNRNVVG